MRRATRFAVALFVILPLLSVDHVQAADYPNKPIRWVLGFAPGGAPDNIARVVGKHLTAVMGQAVILDNRPGANGIIGSDLVAKATPDGYTMLVTSTAFALNAGAYRKLPFDPIKSFAPITNLCLSPGMLLVVNASFPARSVQALIEMAEKPGSKLLYGTSGVGNATHLAGALFNVRAGTNLTPVPYKGGGPMTTALLSNEIHVVFTNPATINSQLKAGRIRALAYIAAKRAPSLPDVPTMAEAGVSGTEMEASWHGLFAPAKTPPAVVARLEGEIRKALALPEVKERFVNLGLFTVGSTSSEFGSFVANSIKRLGEIARVAGIQPE